MKILTLKKRKDFIRAASAFKVVTNGLVLQAALNSFDLQKNTCHIGYTATKKLGKAHIRNRTKRRLRAAVALVMPQSALSGIDYVLVGRHNTTTLKFDYLVRKLKNAVIEINSQINAVKAPNAEISDNSTN